MSSEAKTRKTVERLEKEVKKLTGDVAVALQQMEDWRMMAKVLAQELEGKNLEIKALRCGKAAEALQLESEEAKKECKASGSKRQRPVKQISHDGEEEFIREDEDDDVDELTCEDEDEDDNVDEVTAEDEDEDDNVDELIAEDEDEDDNVDEVIAEDEDEDDNVDEVIAEDEDDNADELNAEDEYENVGESIAENEVEDEYDYDEED